MHSCIHYVYTISFVFLCIFALIQRRAEGDHTGQEYTGKCFILICNIYCVLFILVTCIYIMF